jgi:hypothetical protein
MTDLYPAVEGFFVTTLASDLTAVSSVISLTALPVRITKGYMVIEPSSATKREVVHFTSVGVSSVTTADDTTDATDATGRGCLGSVNLGALTTHDQGVTVIIAAVEQYWARTYAAFTTAHNVDGTFKSGSVLTLPQINDTTADHQYVFAVSELAADRTVTLPLLIGNDTFVFADFIQTLVGKTLTAPKIVNGGFIADANGNELIIFTTVASAVNEITYANAATNTSPSIIPSGETNVGLDIRMKGTGKLRKPTVVGIQVIDATTNTATGDAKAYFRVPAELGGMNLTGVAASVYTAGTTNTTDIQIRNKTQTADMLSTKITIDSTETDTSTAATAAVIDADNDDVATGDILAIDIDAVSTTAAKGLYIEMRFELP